MSLLARYANYARVLRHRLAGAEIGPRCRIAPHVGIEVGRGRLKLGPKCHLAAYAQICCYDGSIEAGSHIFFGQFTTLYGHGGIIIGDNTLIGNHVSIIAANHTIPPRGQLIRHEPDVPLPIRIGRDAWIGAGVRVLGGVTIGDGCVVGAGAVVTNDLPPWTVAVGVPARVIRERE